MLALGLLGTGFLTACSTPDAAREPLILQGGPAKASAAVPARAQGLSPIELAATLSHLDGATRAPYRSHLVASEGTSYLLQPARSEVRIYAFREGAIGMRLGHNHVISVPQFAGLAWAPAKGLRGGSADFSLRLSEIALDAPALRQETGGAFGTVLKDSDIKGTLDHLLGEQGFQAERFPVIAAKLVVETGEAPIAIADLALSLHGETHHQRIVMKVLADAQGIEAQGSFAFRQGDFGLKPYAMLGGLLAVDELVAVSFTLRGSALKAGQL